jgi:hypothetical protein
MTKREDRQVVVLPVLAAQQRGGGECFDERICYLSTSVLTLRRGRAREY